MKKFNFKALLWELPLIALAFWVLKLEIATYSNLKGSIGESLLYPNQKNVMVVSYSIVAVLGASLILFNNKIVKIVLVCLILFILLLFYPIFDMEGEETPF
jgi:hypothetical protein